METLIGRWTDAIPFSKAVSAHLLDGDDCTPVGAMGASVCTVSFLFASRVNGSKGWSALQARRCVRFVWDKLMLSCIRAARFERLFTKTEEACRAFFKVQCLKACKSLLQLQPSQFEPTHTIARAAAVPAAVFASARSISAVSLPASVSSSVCNQTSFSCKQMNETETVSTAAGGAIVRCDCAAPAVSVCSAVSPSASVSSPVCNQTSISCKQVSDDEAVGRCVGVAMECGVSAQSVQPNEWTSQWAVRNESVVGPGDGTGRGAVRSASVVGPCDGSGRRTVRNRLSDGSAGGAVSSSVANIAVGRGGCARMTIGSVSDHARHFAAWPAAAALTLGALRRCWQ